MRVADKVAIVTGASRGIGASCAVMLAEEGADIVLAARSTGELEQVRERIEGLGRRAICVKTDVRDRDSVKNMADTAMNEFGKIDVLVNNAGYPMFGYAIDDKDPGAEERYEAIMETNVRGYWYAARFVVPYMKAAGSGSIINISSVRGHLGLANETAYCLAKGAVKMFTKSLAVELAPHNIRVNCISPGAIQVDIGHWVLSRYGKEVHKEYVERFKDVHLYGMVNNQPLHMLGEPKDIGYMAIYLASDESRFVTGSDMVVDGGLTSVLPEPGALDMPMLHDLYEKQKPMNDWLASVEAEQAGGKE
ncbi:MAG: SDR family NAD(P)-dependent oxidoreductase [Oscillospiraceae bacterium]